MKIKKVSKPAPEIVGFTTVVDLPPFLRPKFADKVEWPDDITRLESRNVSELLGKYTALLCYAGSQLAKSQVDLMKVEYQMSALETKIYIEEPTIARLEKNKRELKLSSDDGMIILESRRSILKRFIRLQEVYVQNYERKITALSRELSRKTASGDGLRYSKVKD
jgi:hypothetical protein